jgi:LuxR family maltose regulon positive regulatory protein
LRRERLESVLDRGLAEGRSLTLVSAPPGYGKSTLVAEWLRSTGHVFSWLTLDSGDNDPMRFFANLEKALDPVRPGSAPSLASLFGAPALPNPDAVAGALAGALAAQGWPRPFILVLDDLHTIRNPFIFDVLRLFVHSLPQSVQLILITREDPPVQLGRLRVLGLLTEIRQAQLMFKDEEAEAFFGHMLPGTLPEEDVHDLTVRTEGWIAGLQLAALSLQGLSREDSTGFVERFSGTNRYVIDYLVEEVLERQPEETKQFLIETSVLEQLCPALCEQVTGRACAGQTLAEFERANLFMSPLDGTRHWYRYHPLFSSVLSNLLEPARERELRKRAAMWLDENGYVDEAISQAMRCGDPAYAASLVGRSAKDSVLRGEPATLLSRIESLPQDVVASNVQLSAYRAWCLFFTGRMREAASVISTINAEQGEADSLTQGIIYALTAWLAEASGNQENRLMADKALELFGDQEPYFKVITLIPRAHTLNATSIPKGTEALREAYALSRSLKHPYVPMGALFNLAFNLYMEGRLREARALCEEAVARSTNNRGEVLAPAGPALIMAGVLAYEADETGVALESIRHGLDLCRSINLERTLGGDAEETLAAIYMAQGNAAAALEVLEQARIMALETGLRTVARTMEARQAEIHLRLGDTAKAGVWALNSGLSSASLAVEHRGTNLLVYARYLMATGRSEEFQQLVTAGIALTKRIQARTMCIRTLNLCVLDALRRGDEAGAVEFLRESVRLAGDEPYCRIYLDEGPALLRIMPKVRDEAPALVNRVVAASNRRPAQTEQAAQSSSLAEPLSFREIEVLRLVERGLSNDEIADDLFISTGTVKWHLCNIFGKMAVKNRVQAVAAAKALGLLKD